MNANPKSTEQAARGSDSGSFTEMASAVARHSFLQDFSITQLDQMAQCGGLRDFQPGDLIFKQGGPADAFYLIVWGAVSLTHAGLNGNTAIMAIPRFKP